MKTKNFLLACLASASLAAIAGASTLEIPLVPVGDPGNVADPLTGYGAVPYVYQMGEFDVTVGEYCQFLNAVAKTDTYGLYNAEMAPGALYGFNTFGIAQNGSPGKYSYSVGGSYGQGANCPIYNVTWGDAARFVNWLANGQPTGAEGPGTTETGTYALSGATSNAALMAVSRNPGSTWVLPTVDEWYKAAYYSSGGTNSAYWLYATQSDSTPSNLLSAMGTNNANFATDDIVPPNYGFTDHANGLTPVGAFADSPSAFGTYDQNGNVDQWNETAYGGVTRGCCGGSFGDGPGAMLSTTNEGTQPAYEGVGSGFRVAYVPEPASLYLLVAGAIVFFMIRQRFIRQHKE